LNIKKIFLYSLLVIISASFYSCSSSGSGEITTEDPDEAFNIAKRIFDRGDYVAAIEAFSFIKIKFPGSKNVDKIQFYLAESYFNRKEFLLAAYEYENMLKNYPLSNYITESRYKLGLCYYNLSPKYSLDQEFTNYAINELQLFVELYPNDILVPDASRKLMELKDKLAYKYLMVGEQYMLLDDYRAASIYFEIVYSNYIDSRYADEAMVDHAEALVNIKKYEDAQKVLSRFFKLFPNSQFRQKAETLKSTIQGASK
jgi:outer membrane protein assembly factor BamD